MTHPEIIIILRRIAVALEVIANDCERVVKEENK